MGKKSFSEALQSHDLRVISSAIKRFKKKPDDLEKEIMGSGELLNLFLKGPLKKTKQKGARGKYIKWVPFYGDKPSEGDYAQGFSTFWQILKLLAESGILKTLLLRSFNKESGSFFSTLLLRCFVSKKNYLNKIGKQKTTAHASIEDFFDVVLRAVGWELFAKRIIGGGMFPKFFSDRNIPTLSLAKFLLNWHSQLEQNSHFLLYRFGGGGRYGSHILMVAEKKLADIEQMNSKSKAIVQRQEVFQRLVHAYRKETMCLVAELDVLVKNKKIDTIRGLKSSGVYTDLALKMFLKRTGNQLTLFYRKNDKAVLFEKVKTVFSLLPFSVEALKFGMALTGTDAADSYNDWKYDLEGYLSKAKWFDGNLGYTDKQFKKLDRKAFYTVYESILAFEDLILGFQIKLFNNLPLNNRLDTRYGKELVSCKSGIFKSIALRMSVVIEKFKIYFPQRYKLSDGASFRFAMFSHLIIYAAVFAHYKKKVDEGVSTLFKANGPLYSIVQRGIEKSFKGDKGCSPHLVAHYKLLATKILEAREFTLDQFIDATQYCFDNIEQQDFSTMASARFYSPEKVLVKDVLELNYDNLNKSQSLIKTLMSNQYVFGELANKQKIYPLTAVILLLGANKNWLRVAHLFLKLGAPVNATIEELKKNNFAAHVVKKASAEYVFNGADVAIGGSEAKMYPMDAVMRSRLPGSIELARIFKLLISGISGWGGVRDELVVVIAQEQVLPVAMKKLQLILSSEQNSHLKKFTVDNSLAITETSYLKIFARVVYTECFMSYSDRGVVSSVRSLHDKPYTREGVRAQGIRFPEITWQWFRMIFGNLSKDVLLNQFPVGYDYLDSLPPQIHVRLLKIINPSDTLNFEALEKDIAQLSKVIKSNNGFFELSLIFKKYPTLIWLPGTFDFALSDFLMRNLSASKWPDDIPALISRLLKVQRRTNIDFGQIIRHKLQVGLSMRYRGPLYYENPSQFEIMEKKRLIKQDVLLTFYSQIAPEVLKVLYDQGIAVNVKSSRGDWTSYGLAYCSKPSVLKTEMGEMGVSKASLESEHERRSVILKDSVALKAKREDLRQRLVEHNTKLSSERTRVGKLIAIKKKEIDAIEGRNAGKRHRVSFHSGRYINPSHLDYESTVIMNMTFESTSYLEKEIKDLETNILKPLEDQKSKIEKELSEIEKSLEVNENKLGFAFSAHYQHTSSSRMRTYKLHFFAGSDTMPKTKELTNNNKNKDVPTKFSP